MVTYTAKLTWPANKQDVKLIDNEYSPKGNAHLISIKDFSFFSNPPSDYGGDDTQFNPEDLLLSALSSCFFMTFYSLLPKANLELSHYECNSELFLGGEKIKFAEKITLNLKLKFNSPAEHEKVVELAHKAHKYCIIANSIKAEISFNIELI